MSYFAEAVLMYSYSLAMVDSMVRMQLTLEMEWVDHRLEYHNLDKGAGLDFLSYDELQNIWTPSLIFINTEERDITRLSYESEVGVRLSGNSTRSGEDVAHEIRIFKGEENPLIWTEKFVKSMKCIFNLEMFPFDIQVTHFPNKELST